MALEDFKSQMTDGLRRTKQTGLEHGFTVCKIDGSFEMGNICVGSECDVAMKRCQWPTTYLQFHTHPPGKGMILSPEDIRIALADHADYTCIGSVTSKKAKNGVVQCYSIDHEQHQLIREFMNAWWGTENPLSTSDELKRSYDYIVDLLADILEGESPLLRKSERWNVELK